MSDTRFLQFYTSFVNKNDNVQKYLTNVNKFAIQKILFYAMQVDSKLYNIDLSTFRCLPYIFGNYIIYYRDNIAFIITNNGNVFIEIPSSERIHALVNMEIYKIPEMRNYNIEINDDYTITSSGLVTFRDVHDTFYELQYEGKTADALKYAMDVFKVIE